MAGGSAHRSAAGPTRSPAAARWGLSKRPAGRLVLGPYVAGLRGTQMSDPTATPPRTGPTPASTISGAPPERGHPRTAEPPGPGSGPMPECTAWALGAVLILALLAGLIGLGLVFKVADDGQQAVRLAAVPAASPSSAAAPPAATPGAASAAPGTTAAPAETIPDTARVGVWDAPTIPGLHVQLTPDVSLLALAAVSGFVGALVHALTVLVVRKGRGRLDRSFALWYIGGPMTGAAVALILFAAVHGGLLVGGGGDASLNLYGIVALSGVAGLFARKATEKLAELMSDIGSSPRPGAPENSAIGTGRRAPGDGHPVGSRRDGVRTAGDGARPEQAPSVPSSGATPSADGAPGEERRTAGTSDGG